MRKLLKFHRYAFEWENYLLLFRTMAAAWRVRRLLEDLRPSPQFGATLRAIDGIYLTRQPGWSISDYEKIERFAAFIVEVPFQWGRCVHRSLISYRLLNGYGYPARVCLGVNRDRPEAEGHAWITISGRPEYEFAGKDHPPDNFQLVYTSPPPHNSRT